MRLRAVVVAMLWMCGGCARDLVVGLDGDNVVDRGVAPRVDGGVVAHDAGVVTRASCVVDAGLDTSGVIDAGPCPCSVDRECTATQTCVRGLCTP